MCSEICSNLFADDSMSYTSGTSKSAVQNDPQLDVNNVGKRMFMSIVLAKVILAIFAIL